jgi:fused signal recognition particle receptor
LVLDATTGNNAINQARIFDEAVDLDGIVLTKLDGSAKGGFVVSLCSELQIPVLFVGVGEKLEDLEPFNPEEFIDNIL